MNDISPVQLYDRGALYYPYIHIRDEEWLKATLLAFPYIERMVPSSFILKDQSASRSFAEIDSRLPGIKLLSRRDVGGSAVIEAQNKIASKIEEDIAADGTEFISRFSRANFSSDGYDGYQIHDEKFLDPLKQILRQKYEGVLIWRPSNRGKHDTDWWSIHPALGTVIMAATAAAIAHEQRLDIVTHSEQFYDLITLRDPSIIYDKIIRGTYIPYNSSMQQLNNELFQIVIASNFNLSILTPTDILELGRQRADIASLKAEFASLVASIDPASPRDVVRAHLQLRAQEAIFSWRDRAASVSGFSRRLFGAKLFTASKDELKDIVYNAVPIFGASAAASNFGGLALGIGVAITTHACASAHAEITNGGQSTFKFLSSVKKHVRKAKYRRNILVTQQLERHLSKYY